MKTQRLSDGYVIELRKASNGVIIRPAPGYGDDRTITNSAEVMVFDSVEPLIEWVKEFFPEAA